MIAYKIFRRRKNGTLGPLFINRGLHIVAGVWYEAEDHQTPGYAHRPGWHATRMPLAPHLKLDIDGRRWYKVELGGRIVEHRRPQAQGGIWLLADRMRVIHECDDAYLQTAYWAIANGRF